MLEWREKDDTNVTFAWDDHKGSYQAGIAYLRLDGFGRQGGSLVEAAKRAEGVDALAGVRGVPSY